jgi:hypothetical protein
MRLGEPGKTPNHDGSHDCLSHQSQREGYIRSRRRGLNPRPADYESAALPLSYFGARRRRKIAFRSHYGKNACAFPSGEGRRESCNVCCLSGQDEELRRTVSPVR